MDFRNEYRRFVVPLLAAKVAQQLQNWRNRRPPKRFPARFWERAYLRKYGYRRGMRRTYARKGRGKKKPKHLRRQPRTKIGKRVNNLSTKVRRIDKFQKGNMGTLVYRDISVSDEIIPANQIFYRMRSLNNISNLETVCAQLRYYDPSDPSNLVVADFTTGTYFKEVLFVKCTLHVTIRCNYNLPVEVTVYRCDVKADTDQNPSDCLASGTPDMTNATSTNPLIYPSDINLLNDLWYVKKIHRSLIQAGAQRTFTMSVDKPFNYDPHLTDTHALSFQRVFYGTAMLFRYRGVPAHDSVADEQGLQNCEVDVEMRRTWKVKYNAGADIKYIYTDTSGLDTFTNTANISNKPKAEINILTV